MPRSLLGDSEEARLGNTTFLELTFPNSGCRSAATLRLFRSSTYQYVRFVFWLARPPTLFGLSFPFFSDFSRGGECPGICLDCGFGCLRSRRLALAAQSTALLVSGNPHLFEESVPPFHPSKLSSLPCPPSSKKIIPLCGRLPGHCLERGFRCLRSWLAGLAAQSTALLASGNPHLFQVPTFHPSKLCTLAASTSMYLVVSGL